MNGIKTYYITDFGAKPNGDLMTDEIQSAIDNCFLNGGGIVVVTEGDFYTGGIRLRSNVTLYLKKNAHLIGSRNPSDYFAILNDKIEPIKTEDISDVKWLPPHARTTFDHLNKCGSSWNNALIRAIDAHNISIIGEEGAYIDGQDCFDESGEEYYRGPHAINMHRCENIKLDGYTIKNSANWAHALFYCKNIDIQGVEVRGGHDGIHIRSCTNIVINSCKLYTGDDCIAGFADLNVTISDCVFNTACSGMRFGGTNVIVEKCKFTGPAKYIFRGSLNDDEKRSGKTSKLDDNHRYNMLSAYTYYSDFTMAIKNMPGNIVIENCEIENTDRFFHYNFSGNEPWQCNKPLNDIKFKNISAKGIKMPLTMYGSDKSTFVAALENVRIEFEKNISKISFIHAAWFDKIILNNVEVINITGDPIIKTWSKDGDIILENFVCGDGNTQLIALTSEDFVCKAI